MRLTIKVNNEYITNDTKCMKNKYINKLGQLEDIEEELGIDLVTLFKALKNGIWYKTKGKPYFNYFDISLTNKCFRRYVDYFKDYLSFDFKDYGKTWALTKEELEK